VAKKVACPQVPASEPSRTGWPVRPVSASYWPTAGAQAATSEQINRMKKRRAT
jgi:hypothetical protein